MERRALLEVKHLNSFYEEGNGILSAGKRRKQVLQERLLFPVPGRDSGTGG